MNRPIYENSQRQKTSHLSQDTHRKETSHIPKDTQRVKTNMNRPIYENSATLSDEAKAKTAIENQWHCTLSKLPRSYHMDWMATRNNRGVGFVEYKRRHNAALKYPTIFISLLKLMAAQKLYSATGLQTTWVIEWEDMFGHVSLNAHPDEIKMGGRADRNDPADQEIMAHFAQERITYW
jgi:hypothetical protein